MTEAIRLSKRVAELRGCSRREAEQLIEGGWVRVSAQVVEEPQARVRDERVEIDGDAQPRAMQPVTVLLHKPVGAEAGLGRLPGSQPASQWLVPAQWAGEEGAGLRPLKKHLRDQELVAPLAPRASGLVVFTQDWRIARKLREDARLLEHEVVVEVAGTLAPGALERLNRADHGFTLGGHPLGPCKVSWQSETRLRFALKGEQPGQIAFMCEAVGLTVQGMRRIRIGRVAMGRLPVGQWRHLAPHELF
jgi:23S rRNA pseudouridine2604 synthase